MNRLAGKTAMITGAASGIGLATAILFAKEGAKIAVVDIDASRGDAAISAIREQGGEAWFFRADVLRAADVKILVDGVISQFGRIDVLHNNVGGWQKELKDTITDSTEQEWDRLIDLNLKGTFLVSKQVIPHMIQARGGSIINTVTTNAFMNYLHEEAYGSAKAAVVQLTKSMAMDYAKYGIRVNGIAPGEVRTPQREATYTDANREAEQTINRKIPLGRVAEPEDVALAALFLASEDSRYVTGNILFVDGGLMAGFYDTNL
jgi:NAD(P)-dependent dehydrogenase (short-subunit alcohol dehydrogenase family)